MRVFLLHHITDLDKASAEEHPIFSFPSKPCPNRRGYRSHRQQLVFSAFSSSGVPIVDEHVDISKASHWSWPSFEVEARPGAWIPMSTTCASKQSAVIPHEHYKETGLRVSPYGVLGKPLVSMIRLTSWRVSLFSCYSSRISASCWSQMLSVSVEKGRFCASMLRMV